MALNRKSVHGVHRCSHRQRELPFGQPKETRAQRCERLLSGELGRVVRPASELVFDYEQASRIARRTPGGAGKCWTSAKR